MMRSQEEFFFFLVGKDGLKGKSAVKDLSSTVGMRSWMSGFTNSGIKQRQKG